MKLLTFQIKNYKSIQDTGVCFLSDQDNVTVLAGQNESGKSSVLQAIYDFEMGALRADAQRDDTQSPPEIICSFEMDSKDKKSLFQEELESEGGLAGLYAGVKKALTKTTRLTLRRVFDSDAPSMQFLEEDAVSIQQIIDNFTEVVRGSEEAQQEEMRAAEAAKAAVPDAASTVAGTVAPTPPTAPAPSAIQKLKVPILSEICTATHRYTPAVAFFDDQQDLLPKSITVVDLEAKKSAVNGYSAVSNLQKAFGLNLLDLDKTKSRAQKTSKTEDFNQIVTADFRDYWSQKIHGDNKVDIEIAHYEGNGQGGEFEFYILTKEKERLYPAQRSRGFQWYLSFYLELKAQSTRSEQGLVILFDEPGLYLHAKAQTDIKKLFEELAKKGCQIIYSTHSPYLIDVDKLNRLRLIINDGSKGTLVEKITSDKLKGKKLDSLKPVIDAMGLEVASYLNPINKRNVIVEGISDFYYCMAMKKILNRTADFGFLPSQGAPNSHLLMELCIGWGVEWQLLFDDDRESQEALQKIREQFGGDDVSDKTYVLSGCEGIENMLLPSDVKLVEPSASPKPEDNKAKFIQDNCGGKELFARRFLDKVNGGSITADKLTKHALDEYTKLFDALEKGFGLRA
jgi:hypothetical protein